MNAHIDPALTRPLALWSYSGIGSRDTPPVICNLMTAIASKLAAETSFVLRSGGADGADSAFARGAGGRAEIYLPWRSFAPGQHPEAHLMVTGDDPRARELAASLHPAWDRCTRGARALHTRNVHQVLGRDLDRPSHFMLCWTQSGRPQGGSATAMRLAMMRGVKLYNLSLDTDREQWISWCCGDSTLNPFDASENDRVAAEMGL